MSKYRPLVPVDPSILSSYGEKPLFHLAGGQACDDVAAALLALSDELPWMRVTDCFREVKTQVALRRRYDHWVASGKPTGAAYDVKTMKNAFVATPGKSLHNAGRAVDLNTELMQEHLGKEYLDAFWPIAAKYGFTPIIGRPDEGTNESWHFDCWLAWKPVRDKVGADAASLCCTLDVGQAGEFQSDERLVQALLLRAGFDIGAPDGMWGKKTWNALNLAGGAAHDVQKMSKDTLIEMLRQLPWGTGTWIGVG